MNENSLFRQEVFTHSRNQHFGSVFINTPLHYSLLCVGSSLLLLGLILFVACAEFSEKCIVTGYLNSNKGMVRVYPKQQGIISQRLVKQGATVRKGEPLFFIDTSSDDLNAKNAPKLWVQFKKKQQLLAQEVLHKQHGLDKLKPLLQKKYISLATYNTKLDEISTLVHQQHQLKMDFIKYQQSRSYVIRAPVDGVVTSVMYQVGQYITSARALLNIVPLHSHLIAELFVPVKHVGFLNKSDQVVLRYDAYPYQTFGVAAAKIVEISQNILTDAEEDKPLRIGQPYYKAKAYIDKQTVKLYGEARPLKLGMTFSAVLNGPKKKLWRWIMMPLP